MLRWASNSSTVTPPKHASRQQYKQATALEALVGSCRGAGQRQSRLSSALSCTSHGCLWCIKLHPDCIGHNVQEITVQAVALHLLQPGSRGPCMDAGLPYLHCPGFMTGRCRGPVLPSSLAVGVAAGAVLQWGVWIGLRSRAVQSQAPQGPGGLVYSL